MGQKKNPVKGSGIGVGIGVGGETQCSQRHTVVDMSNADGRLKKITAHSLYLAFWSHQGC